MQTVKNPEKKWPGTQSWVGSRQQPRPEACLGAQPRSKATLINQQPGAKLQGPERPNNGQEVAHKRIKYLVNLLEVVICGIGEAGGEHTRQHSTEADDAHK